MKITRIGLNPNEIALRESLFHVANGYIGVRACFEEGIPSALRTIRGTYINAFFDTYDILYSEKLFGFPDQAQTIVNVADLQSITIELGGETFDPFSGELPVFEQSLDMSAGRYIRTMLWQSPKGRETEIVFQRMASFHQKELLTIQLTITPKNWSGSLKIISAQFSDVFNDGDPNDPRKARERKRMLLPVESGFQQRCIYMQCETVSSKQTMASVAAHTFPDSISMTCHSSLESNTSILRGDAVQGESLSIVKWCIFTDCRRHQKPLTEALHLAHEVCQTPIEIWYTRQEKYLDSFWNASRVIIDGDPALQTGVDYAVYSLLQSAGQDGISSIASKGLSGEGYEGHYFWDTEIYMFPFFLLTNPQIARSLLEYRYCTLNGAREQAKLLGHQKGALFPWRTITGSECSSYYPSGSAQYHINSDIAHAIITYYFVTGDLEFIRDMGVEILIETCRLWLDAGHWYEGQFRIDGVTGPDEYTCLINNNYYTNLSVQFQLRNTLLICNRLTNTHQNISLQEQYGLSEVEIESFQEAADHMYLPYNKTLGIYAQDDSFLQKKKLDLQAMDQSQLPLLLHFHPLSFYRTQVCKQADAVLAHFLYEDGIDEDDIRRTYDYYEMITTHDSSLSPCVFSMMAARIGETEKALQYYMHSVHLDFENKQHNTDDGIHAANMGGTYMGIVYGFAGLRIHPDSISFRPCIPKSFTRYAFPIQYRKQQLHIEVTQEKITVHSEAEHSVSITVYDHDYLLNGQPLTLPLSNSRA